MTASLNLMRSGARSQWKLARASVVCSERRRPAIDRAAALMTLFYLFIYLHQTTYDHESITRLTTQTHKKTHTNLKHTQYNNRILR